MGVQETLKLVGLRAKMRFGFASPEDRGQLVVKSLMMILNHLHATVHWTQVAEGARDMASTPEILRGINRDAYTKRVEQIVEEYGMDRDEALGLEPDKFFGMAGRVILQRGVIHAIVSSTTLESQRQRSLAAIREEFGKRAQNPSLSSEMHGVFQWFYTTGFDEAVALGEMQRDLIQNPQSH